jgi:hypothetical protein
MKKLQIPRPNSLELRRQNQVFGDILDNKPAVFFRMKKTLAFLIALFLPVYLISQEKTLWETSIKDLSGMESYVLQKGQQPCNIGRSYETLIDENKDTLYCTHYGIAFEGKLYATLHIFNNRSKGKIEVIFKLRDAGILDEASGSYDVKAEDFEGLVFEKKVVANLLAGGKKELVLRYISAKKQHINCQEIMDFALNQSRLHYRINN